MINEGDLSQRNLTLEETESEGRTAYGLTGREAIADANVANYICDLAARVIHCIPIPHDQETLDVSIATSVHAGEHITGRTRVVQEGYIGSDNLRPTQVIVDFQQPGRIRTYGYIYGRTHKIQEANISFGEKPTRKPTIRAVLIYSGDTDKRHFSWRGEKAIGKIEKALSQIRTLPQSANR